MNELSAKADPSNALHPHRLTRGTPTKSHNVRFPVNLTAYTLKALLKCEPISYLGTQRNSSGFRTVHARLTVGPNRWTRQAGED